MLHTIFSKLVLFTFLTISFNVLSAQTDEEVLNEILWDLFDPCQERLPDTIFIEKTKKTTFFAHDSYSYEYINGFSVPSTIISEWKNNITNQFFSTWDENLLNRVDTTIIGKDTIIVKKPIFKCLSEYEIYQMFDKNKEIFSIGKIIFDKSKENALFRIEISTSDETVMGYSVFIKKTFGKWIIITRFDYWMT